MRSARLKSKVKGTEDIKCLPTAPSVQDWEEAVDDISLCGKRPKSRVSAENGCAPGNAAAVADSPACFPGVAVVCRSPHPSLLPHDYWQQDLRRGQKDTAPSPREGARSQASPVHAATHTNPQTGPPPCSGGAETYLLGRLRAEPRVHAAPWRMASWLSGDSAQAAASLWTAG